MKYFNSRLNSIWKTHFCDFPGNQNSLKVLNLTLYPILAISMTIRSTSLSYFLRPKFVSDSIFLNQLKTFHRLLVVKQFAMVTICLKRATFAYFKSHISMQTIATIERFTRGFSRHQNWVGFLAFPAFRHELDSG